MCRVNGLFPPPGPARRSTFASPLHSRSNSDFLSFCTAKNVEEIFEFGVHVVVFSCIGRKPSCWIREETWRPKKKRRTQFSTPQTICLRRWCSVQHTSVLQSGKHLPIQEIQEISASRTWTASLLLLLLFFFFFFFFFFLRFSCLVAWTLVKPVDS